MLMKAIVISAPGQATLAEVPLRALASSDVRVRVLAAGVCGTDVELLDGTMPYLTSGVAHYPLTPGHEWVGEVLELGAQVTGLRTGDRVVGECSCGCLRCERCKKGHYHRCSDRTETGILNRSGAFAEYVDFPARFLHRISADVPVESACLVEPAAVAFNGVRRAGVSPSEDVAIFGDGPIGLLLLMMARACGARSVTVIGASAPRLALAEKLGADALVNVHEVSPSAAFGSRPDRRPSVVLEATGKPEAVNEAVQVAAPGGRIILQGIFAAQKLNGLDLDRVVTGEITLQGALGSPGIWPDVIRMIEAERVNPSLLVTEVLPLGQYHQAIEQVRRHSGVKTIFHIEGK